MPDAASRNVRRVMALALVGMVVGLAACSSSSKSSWDDPGPETRFEKFLMNWFRYDRKRAFEMIAPDDREVLTRSLEVVDEKIGDDVLEPHEMLVAGRVDNPYDLERIETERELESRPEEGTVVDLSLIYHDGRNGEATMVWRDDTWFVDLPLAGEEATGGDASPTDTESDESRGTEGDAGESGETEKSMDAEMENDVQGESRE